MWKRILEEIFGVEFRSDAPFRADIEDLTEHYAEHVPDFAFDRVVVCAPYAGRVEEAIRRFKYDRIREESKALAPLVQEGLKYLRLRNGDDVPFLVTWVPIGFVRFWSRGFNQSSILAKSLAKAERLEHRKCLSRMWSGRHQAHLDARTRAENAKGRFASVASAKKHIAGRHVILVDDVITTGATANECAKILRSMGAKQVSGLFVARSRS